MVAKSWREAYDEIRVRDPSRKIAYEGDESDNYYFFNPDVPPHIVDGPHSTYYCKRTGELGMVCPEIQEEGTDREIAKEMLFHTHTKWPSGLPIDHEEPEPPDEELERLLDS